MGTRLLGYGLIVVALVLALAVFYRNSKQSEVPLVFSPQQMLNSTWLNYKNEYLEQGTGRTLDKSRNNITTSEGESYTMLRAVWLGDKSTFDTSWTWTKDNLQHKSGDHLFAWLFGNEGGGTYGVLASQGGNTTASDADTDIALSLIFAYARWQDHAYLGDARNIIQDIWAHDVVVVNGTPYMAADNLEASSSNAAAIDPSYLNPAAYRLFALVDPAHPWLKLVDSSYVVLQKSITAPLDKQKSTGLVPDWVQLDKKTGALSALPSTANTTNFGFDALRAPWRLALDWQWNQEPRAKATLSLMSFLSTEWSADHSLDSVYSHDGSVVQGGETPAMYGGALGYFIVADPAAAQDVYSTKLQFLYDPGKNAWKDKLSYYDDNWAWFGAALYNNLLPNLAADLPASAFKQ